jgi:hypothetical protein
VREFEDLPATTSEELGRLNARPADGDHTGVGRFLDGLVTAEMSTDGRSTGLTIDPSALGTDERVLAREVMTAINLAWADRPEPAEQSADEPPVDPARVRESQDQGIEAMRRFADGMQGMLDQIYARVPK